jgi:hypothetical protein
MGAPSFQVPVVGVIGRETRGEHFWESCAPLVFCDFARDARLTSRSNLPEFTFHAYKDFGLLDERCPPSCGKIGPARIVVWAG